LAKPFIDAEMGKGNYPDSLLAAVVPLIKDRCTLLPDFWAQGHFFFATPEIKEENAIKEKWNDQKQQFFTSWADMLAALPNWDQPTLEESFNAEAAKHGLKKGDVMLPFRIMLVGGKYGPGVFVIAELIGREETIKRIKRVAK
jgi:glutamyl-tRNA synthetase